MNFTQRAPTSSSPTVPSSPAIFRAAPIRSVCCCTVESGGRTSPYERFRRRDSPAQTCQTPARSEGRIPAGPHRRTDPRFDALPRELHARIRRRRPAEIFPRPSVRARESRRHRIGAIEELGKFPEGARLPRDEVDPRQWPAHQRRHLLAEAAQADPTRVPPRKHHALRRNHGRRNVANA